MSHKLSDQERAALNESLDILNRCTAYGSSWMISGGQYRGCPFSYDVTYFDSNEGPGRGQHSNIRGETFADKIETVLGIEARAAENAEKQAARRVEALKAELASLTGEAA